MTRKWKHLKTIYIKKYIGVWVVRQTIEVRILSTFLEGKLFDSHSISDISRQIDAAYPHTHATITEMITQGLLKSYALGRTLLCAPNLENDLTRALLCQAHACIKAKNQTPTLNNLDCEIRKLASSELGLLSVILHEKDLHFIVSDESIKQKIVAMTSMVNLHLWTAKEFIKLLFEDSSALNGTTIMGFDRLLLLLAPYREQLMLNHAVSFREVIQ